jgi:hypothetical protein
MNLNQFSSHRDSQQRRLYVSRKNECTYYQMCLASVGDALSVFVHIQMIMFIVHCMCVCVASSI